MIPGQAIVIDDGDSNMGAAIAREFHRAGWNVVLLAQANPDKAGLLAEAMNTVRKDSMMVVEIQPGGRGMSGDIASRSRMCFGRVDAMAICDDYLHRPGEFDKATLSETFGIAHELVHEIWGWKGSMVGIFKHDPGKGLAADLNRARVGAKISMLHDFMYAAIGKVRVADISIVEHGHPGADIATDIRCAARMAHEFAASDCASAALRIDGKRHSMMDADLPV